jgi:SAM-dependent methyltransferase
MEDVSTLVARQYDAYAYPEPIADIAAKIAEGYSQLGDPAMYAPMLWPGGRPNRRLRILAAGCGTVQAAYLAFTNRDADVIGVDLSETALAHERFLQEKHGLSNMRLYRGDLLEIAAIGSQFDVIVCSGVLHHMADPGAGLRALRDVLAPDGVMVLMLYGAAPRTGVYMLQDVFRRMRVPQNSAGVAFVRRVLSQLPERHYARWYLRGTDELKHDAAIVDTFLHPQDRAYTVPQLLGFLEANGVAFQGWVDNSFYYPQATYALDSDVGRVLATLPDREQWAAVEMLTQACGMHVFLACRGDRPGADYAVSPDAPGWERLVPHFTPGLVRVHDLEYRRGRHVLQLAPEEAAVFAAIDGNRTIAELAGNSGGAHQDFVRRFIGYGWRLGHLMLARS